jgi:predicted RNase H-like HicB family nuclease
MNTRELIFEVREEAEGGYSAEALGVSIFTQGDTWAELRENVQDATRLYYEGEGAQAPTTIRLLLRREETLVA